MHLTGRSDMNRARPMGWRAPSKRCDSMQGGLRLAKAFANVDKE